MNTKAANERYQRQVQEISKQLGNNTCADCGGRFPRWASWNLGIFICVNCAAVHRKMGTHISKVKSLTLDTWNKEQVEKMREMGNVKNNIKFNPDERKNRPPANIEEGERNSELERFIFDKYRGKFMDSKPPPVPMKDKWHISPNPTGSSGESSKRQQFPSNSLGAPTSIPRREGRSSTSPFPSTWAEAQRAASVSPALPTTSSTSSANLKVTPAQPTSTGQNGLAPPVANVPPRSSSANPQPLNGLSGNQMRSVSGANGISNGHLGMATATATASSSVFDDLLSLQEPSGVHVQPSLQMLQPGQQLNPWAHLATQQQAVVSPMVMSNAVNGMESSPFFQQQQQQAQPVFVGTPTGYMGGVGNQHRSASLGAMAFTPTGMHLQPPSHAAMMGGNAFSPQMMGQQAFGGAQLQQQQQQQYFTGGMQSTFVSSMQQQQQQPMMNNNPFGAFSNSMMPTGMQQQQQQPLQNQFHAGQQTQSQQQPFQNTWH